MSDNEDTIKMLVDMLGAEGRARILKTVLESMTEEQRSHLAKVAAEAINGYIKNDQYGTSVRGVVDGWMKLNQERLVAEFGDAIEDKVRQKLATGLDEQVGRVARSALETASGDVMFKVEFYIEQECGRQYDSGQVMDWFLETMEGADFGSIQAVEVTEVMSGCSWMLPGLRASWPLPGALAQEQAPEAGDGGDEEPGR